MVANLVGRVCLVTGGSKGIGRGIALQLGQAGATVYVTGRSKKPLEECCQEITNRGGKGIPVTVDHSNEEEVKTLFDTIKSQQNGKLDVLVNNAYAAVELILNNTGKKFWETDPVTDWDTVNNVGLRNHYICTTYAARLMAPRKSGLIVNVSSGGGLRYLFNVPYGVGKAACDRMAADCGHELRKHNVAVISLWPGPVKTEKIVENVIENANAPKSSKATFEGGETIEFSGKAVANLAADPNVMSKTGRIILTADLAREYNFVDEDGTIPGDFRSVQWSLRKAGWTTLASFVPSFIRVPFFLLHQLANKF